MLLCPSPSLSFSLSSPVCVCVCCSIKRSNCYMVWAGESNNPGQGRNNNGLEIGCMVDTASGLLTFTANGKELNTYYQVRQCVCVAVLMRGRMYHVYQPPSPWASLRIWIGGPFSAQHWHSHDGVCAANVMWCIGYSEKYYKSTPAWLVYVIKG